LKSKLLSLISFIIVSRLKICHAVLAKLPRENARALFSKA
jgi:hypothetical protein